MHHQLLNLKRFSDSGWPIYQDQPKAVAVPATN